MSELREKVSHFAVLPFCFYLQSYLNFETFLFFISRYTALDAIRLISPDDDYFHCESCNGELVAESDKIASQGLADGDDNARRHRRETLEKMLRRMEVCSIPILCVAAKIPKLISVQCSALTFQKCFCFWVVLYEVSQNH